jgi:hypothetical protein
MSNAKKYLSGDNGAPLTDKLLVSIAKHLNKDHLEDMLACARGIAGLDWVEQARVVSLDVAGVDLEVIGADKVQPLRLDFPVPANGVLAFKRMMGEMITEGRAKLGWVVAVDDR